MKNYEAQAEDHFSKITLSENKFFVPEILCSQKGKVKFACLKNDCDQRPFMCEDSNCQCRQIHANCFRLQLSSVISGLEGCKVPTKEFQELVFNHFQRIIDTVCDFRDRFLNNIKRSFEYHGLDNEGRTLLKAFATSSYDLISSKKIWKACMKSEARQKAIIELETVVKGVQRHLTEFESSAVSFCSKIHNEIIPFYITEDEQNLLMEAQQHIDLDKKQSELLYEEIHSDEYEKTAREEAAKKKLKKKKKVDKEYQQNPKQDWIEACQRKYKGNPVDKF